MVEKFLEHVYMVVLPNEEGVIYEVGSTPREVWDKILKSEIMGTGQTRTSLSKKGYKSKRVSVYMKV